MIIDPNRDCYFINNDCTALLNQPNPILLPSLNQPVAEFKEFELRFKFKQRFKYGWFHLKLYQMFQDLSRRLI